MDTLFLTEKNLKEEADGSYQKFIGPRRVLVRV